MINFYQCVPFSFPDRSQKCLGHSCGLELDKLCMWCTSTASDPACYIFWVTSVQAHTVLTILGYFPALSQAWLARQCRCPPSYPFLLLLSATLIPTQHIHVSINICVGIKTCLGDIAGKETLKLYSTQEINWGTQAVQFYINTVLIWIDVVYTGQSASSLAGTFLKSD